MKLKTNSARGGRWSQTTKTLRTALCRRAFGRETPSLAIRSWNGSGPLGVFVDHLKITCTKEGVTLDDGLPF
jgi:hypothetical protein